MLKLKTYQKALLFICCGTVIYIITNYNSLNGRLSFIFLFLCLSLIILLIVKITHKDDTIRTYEEAEKRMDELYRIDGIFKYVNDGFYVTHHSTTDYIKWIEILMINKFVISGDRGVQSGLEIITKDKSLEINPGLSPGFAKFTLQINQNLDIDPSWTVDYTIPQQIERAGLYKDTIYRKNGIS